MAEMWSVSVNNELTKADDMVCRNLGILNRVILCTRTRNDRAYCRHVISLPTASISTVYAVTC